MDGEAGWWTTSGNIGLLPLARAMGVGRQQQVNQRWKLPTFDGTSKWGPYTKQAGVIFEMNNCNDPKWWAFKIIEGLRGKAMEYFDTLPVEVGKDGELLCKEMVSRFEENELGLSLGSKLYQVAQKRGNPWENLQNG